MRRFCTLLLLVAGMAAPAFAAPAKLTPAGQALRQQLLHMERRDKVARLPTGQQEVPTVERLNGAQLREIVERFGWPGKSLVGVDGAAAATYLLLKADGDRPLQTECLGLMEAELSTHDVTGNDYATLLDHLLVAEGSLQQYGTQLAEKDGVMVPLPVANGADLAERRRVLGLVPLAAYLAAEQRAYLAAQQAEVAAVRKDGDVALRAELLALARTERAAKPARDLHLAKLLDQHGWPTYTLVGLTAAEAAWRMIADSNDALRARALPLAEVAARHGECRNEWFASLADQVQNARQGTQHYGTLLTFDGRHFKLTVPLDDPDRVDERRRALALPTLDETIKRFEHAKQARGEKL